MAKRISLDRWLFTVTLVLVFAGLVMVFSASAVMAKERFGSPYTFLLKQASWAVAGMRLRYFGYAFLASLPALYVLIFHVAYRRDRILAFLNPYSDPQGKGFHMIQSLIAVSTGGITGLGLMEGKQKLFYLPEPHTDFIFAVTAEELGLVGALVIIALFAVFLWRGIRTSLHTQDMFGRLLSVGINSMVVVQAFINVSVVLGLMPTKGIPLPFVSYGGRLLFATLACVYVLGNINKQAD